MEVAEFDLTELARRFFAWWASELRDLLPARLKARTVSRAAAIDAVLFIDGRVAAGIADAGRLPQAESAVEADRLPERLLALSQMTRQKTVRLVVPPEACLLRHSSVPRRALAHAGAILRHEIETILPLAPSDILSDWFVETEDLASGQLGLRQVVLARARIAAVEAEVAQAGLSLVRIGVGDAQGRLIPVDLLGRGELSLRAALSRLSPATRLMCCAAALLLVSVPFLVIQRQAAALEMLASERASYPPASAAGRSAADVADFIESRGSRPTIGAVLDDIAARLPASATMTAVRVEGERLDLSFEAQDLSSVAAALGGSGLLANVAAAPEGGNAISATLISTADAGPR